MTYSAYIRRAQVSASLALCLSAITSFALPLEYQYPHPLLPVGERPMNTAVADFNGDGRQDVVVANYGSNNLSVLLGRGVDRLRNRVNYDVAKNPTDVAIGDFNSDGIPDIVASSYAGEFSFRWVASILIGNGDGTFQPLIRLPFDTNTSFYNGRVFVRDFNLDGNDDIAIARSTNSVESAVIGIRLGSGSVGFGSIKNTLTDGFAGLAIDDVDGDDIPDLLYSGDAGGVTVRIGDGNGNFGSAVQAYNGVVMEGLAVGDLDGDTNPDLIALDLSPNVARVFQGDGAGGFALVDFFEIPSGPQLSLYDVQFGNINADSNLDVILSGMAGIQTRVGNGDLTFQEATDYELNGPLSNITLADFNSDGVDDVVYVSTSALSRAVGVTLSRADGTLRRPPAYPVSEGNGTAAAFGIGDVTNDGVADIVVGSGSSSELFVLPGKGNGRFKAAVTYPYTDGTPIAGVFVEDFNADGRKDVAYVHKGSEFRFAGVTIRKSFPNGLLGAEQSKKMNTRVTQAAVGDFNEDGRPDIATSSRYAVFGYPVKGLHVFIVGAYGGLPNILEVSDAPESSGIAVADFNNDNHDDIVIGLDTIDFLRCYAGDGTGNFSYSGGSASALFSRLLAAGDFNNDGNADIVRLTGNSNFSIQIMLGDGDCTFTPGVSFDIDPVSLGSEFLTVADIDGDGNDDILTTVRDSFAMLFLPGRGDGTFRAGRLYAGNGLIGGFGVGDVNSDGKPDLAIGSLKKVSVLLHK